ncbi:MAG: YecA family protein [Polaribacter sp.]
MKTLHIDSIKISDNDELLYKEHHITPYVVSLMDKLYSEIPKGKDSTLKRLTKYINQFPKVPVLKNYLSSFYAQKGNVEKAHKINEIILKEHPNYLFGKLTYALYLMNNDNYEDVPKVLGESLLLHELYPERNEFLLTEVFSYYTITIRYLYHIDKDEEADVRLEVLKEIEPNHHKLEEATLYKTEYVFKKAALQFDIEKERIISVKGKDRRSHLQTTKPPTFHFPKQIGYLYSTDLHNMDESLLTELESLDRKKLVEDLITVLYDSIYRFDYFSESYEDDSETYFPIHAFLILMYLKDDSILDVILEIYRQDHNYIEFWFGYESSEYLVPVLYHIDKNIEDTLISFLKEENIFALNKSEIHSALLARIIYKKTLSKEEALSKIEEILDFLIANHKNENILDTELNAFIIADLMDYGERKTLPKIKKLFDLGIVEFGICGTFKDVEEEINKGGRFNKTFKEYNSIKEVYNSFFSPRNNFTLPESNFEEEDKYDNISSTYPVSSKKIGRNEPCPCGSGKKYKKCCL